MNYRPKIDSFPYRVIELLYEQGEKKACDIRQEIGLDYNCRNSDYSDRSHYRLMIILGRLRVKGIVKRTRRGYYSLVPSIRLFEKPRIK